MYIVVLYDRVSHSKTVNQVATTWDEVNVMADIAKTNDNLAMLVIDPVTGEVLYSKGVEL